jgi:single-strand DNA-binding protein
MKDTNIFIHVGRLTRDAELKRLSTGTAILTFSLAVNRRVKDGDAWKDEASFFDYSYFGKGAEAVAQYMTKGGQVVVEGEVKQDRWEKDGQKHSRVVFVAQNVQLVGGKRDARQDGGQVSPDQPAAFQDDIPF